MWRADVGATEHSFGQMNAAQASWSMMATRRTAPAWIQRLGAFFHEMRSQQTAWPPSPMGSRSAYKICAKLSWLTGWGSPVLLSPEQQEQLRRMEQRAPLLYGPPRAERPAEGNGSSGGSNYEAVQEEVKRQLRGVVSQLEASRREAQDLREEVEFLRAAREQSNANQRLEDQGTRWPSCIAWCQQSTAAAAATTASGYKQPCLRLGYRAYMQVLQPVRHRAYKQAGLPQVLRAYMQALQQVRHRAYKQAVLIRGCRAYMQVLL